MALCCCLRAAERTLLSPLAAPKVPDTTREKSFPQQGCLLKGTGVVYFGVKLSRFETKLSAPLGKVLRHSMEMITHGDDNNDQLRELLTNSKSSDQGLTVCQALCRAPLCGLLI